MRFIKIQGSLAFIQQSKWKKKVLEIHPKQRWKEHLNGEVVGFPNPINLEQSQKFSKLSTLYERICLISSSKNSNTSLLKWVVFCTVFAWCNVSLPDARNDQKIYGTWAHRLIIILLFCFAVWPKCDLMSNALLFGNVRSVSYSGRADGHRRRQGSVLSR